MHQEWHESTEFDESTFAQRVFEIVRQIPEGRVTTYGDIAFALGDPRGARQVGWAIAGSPPGLELPFHRVVNREGFLSGGWAFGHPEILKQRLVAEGVPFRDEYTVDIARCRWTLGASSAPPTKCTTSSRSPSSMTTSGKVERLMISPFRSTTTRRSCRAQQESPQPSFPRVA
ncbi:MAG: methylated-DNA--[protein]-cysteine S-methyltransferase [Thermomicrobiales bacterium]